MSIVSKYDYIEVELIGRQRNDEYENMFLRTSNKRNSEKKAIKKQSKCK